ncbi:MAG: RNA 2',3'-cyclic phosphodiesterase [Maricaulaceae bacterium]
MSLRLFAALPVPPEIADRLVPLQKGVGGASWRPRENFHITLRFFGEIDERLAEDLDHELAAVRSHPFELRLKSAGWFGRKEPGALWVGVAAPQALETLSGRCERAARRIGLPAEKRPFKPHVTLAYLHHAEISRVEAFARNNSLFESPRFWADRFGLYSSWMGKGPSRYVLEAEYPLA